MKSKALEKARMFIGRAVPRRAWPWVAAAIGVVLLFWLFRWQYFVGPGNSFNRDRSDPYVMRINRYTGTVQWYSSEGWF